MRIYIGTKWENRSRAADLAARFEAEGHTITRKWWDYPPFGDVTEQYQREEAIEDLRAVREADVVYFIMEEDLPYRGAWVEFGAALAFGRPVRVIGAEALKCVFSHHPLVSFVRWEDGAE